jgi:hypothetical protein
LNGAVETEPYRKYSIPKVTSKSRRYCEGQEEEFKFLE